MRFCVADSEGQVLDTTFKVKIRSVWRRVQLSCSGTKMTRNLLRIRKGLKGVGGTQILAAVNKELPEQLSPFVVPLSLTDKVVLDVRSSNLRDPS